MRKIGIIALAAVLVAGAAYLAGYLPERRERVAAQTQLDGMRGALDAAEGRVRIGELLGRALTLKEAAMRQNYGQALDLSSGFFDTVLEERKRTSDAGLRDGLTEILAKRDAVTAALAKADPAVVDSLHDVEVRLRQALGYQVQVDAAAAR